MIDAKTFQQRRDRVRSVTGDGVVLFLGHLSLPRNYPDNTYPFRQNSHFLYYAGISRARLALVIDAQGRDVLYGPEEDLDDVVWHGPHETFADAAAKVGVLDVRPIGNLAGDLAKVTSSGRSVSSLRPYQANAVQWLAEILGKNPTDLRSAPELSRAVAEQRSKKSADEIAEVEEALGITREMHLECMRVARPGIKEADVAAAAQRIALASDRAQAYNPIITVRGEVLHNNTYSNTLTEGQLMLVDAGAESPRFYASDITRCFPVSGTFSRQQRDVYEVVLRSQLAAIDLIRPGAAFKDIHLEAARVIAQGLTDLGLMKGSPADAVEAGAHALFYPHGVGHMLGLDVHDMEDLGDIVGYPEGVERSEQFGLNFLRLSRPLEPGHVFTIEPGVYFIPALIDRWRSEDKHKDFIAYDTLESWRGLGGVRIEDDVLCTQSGCRVLGPPIVKAVAEVEAVMADS